MFATIGGRVFQPVDPSLSLEIRDSRKNPVVTTSLRLGHDRSWQ